ncbi:hypothetical protein C7974DRAFT_392868 [Boeremia exigua]|uniref:uncharacterized protein n=1 Tax=Boeremia exigua TaxID=749465 RepID=UPI001E8CF34D|nr:uncharacterized protein C7974DRAFT_392868 [Boeremia exigua]KAH6633496.1 hypothetical protein C7974DRAFT_392868 [Boeremia exigua]
MPAVSQPPSSARRPDMHPQAPPAKHKRFASLLRLPSSSSRKEKDKEPPPAASPRSRRATTNPTTPTAPATNAPSASPSYFSPQPGASGSGTDLRSPGSKRPPASFSGHGIDNSRGPPVTLITRGNSDYARKKAPATTPTQPQRQHSGLPTPIAGLQRTGTLADDDSDTSSASGVTASITAGKPTLSRQSTVTSIRSSRHMAMSRDDAPEFDGSRSVYAARGTKRNVSGTESEDLFMNIAEDTAPRLRALDAAARHDRLRSRIARVNERHSIPSGPHSSSPAHAISAYNTPAARRIPFTSSTDPKTSALPRRSTALPTPSRASYQSPLSSNSQNETYRTRLPELNSKASFTFRKDAELTPSEFLASMRRPSVSESLQTPPKRAATHPYRPSTLSYTPVRKEPRTPQSESRHEISSHHDTESHGSTGPAASVWDELDELKTRIKKIELGGGKTPATSNAAVVQASAERPRTANTSATTVSSSPHQQRKANASPSESTIDAPSNKVHPLLRDALAKAKQHTNQSVYRTLETTATEAIALAEMAGSTGMLGSAASVYSGAGAADRQVRRKADNICRSLTELCIALCDTKLSVAGSAMRSSAAAVARRPSVQVNGESPRAARDNEDTGSVISFSGVSGVSGVSPSRALERIEARRTSMLAASTSNRPSSQDTNSTSDAIAASRVQRAGTSLNRTRRQSDADMDDDEDDTLRAPSRAMTDFRQLRSIDTNTSNHTSFSANNNNNFEKNRHSRTYTSQEPMPELQPSPKFQPSGLRRPTVTGVPNENSLLFRDSPRRYNFDRQSSPAVEKQTVGGLRERLQLGANRANLNRNSIGTTVDLSRSMSLGRTRMRGASTGE